MTMNDKMGNLNAPGVSGKVTYHDGELFLLDELHNAEEISVIPMDMRVFIFVLQGEASFVFNEKVCTLHGHELFVSMANNVLSRWKSSEDFRCRCICASSAYTQRIVPMTRNLWEVSFWLKKNPVYPLLPEDMEALCRYYDLLCLQRHAALPLQGKIVDTLMQSLSYKIEEVLGRTMNVDPSSFSSGELLFQRASAAGPVGGRIGDRVDAHAQHRFVSPFEGEARNGFRRGLPGCRYSLFQDIGRNVPEARGNPRHPFFGGDGPDLGARCVVALAGAQHEGQQPHRQHQCC